MKRRQFLRLAGAAPMAGCWLDVAHASEFPQVAYEKWFEADNAEVLALAKRVMQKCVLPMLRKPKPPSTRTWVSPGDPHYLGQWIWDTMFVLDHLCLLPGREAQIRDIFQNYWDFQDRWDAAMPEYARDMITVAIKTEPQEQRQFSQIPILAWGAERIFQRNGDKKLLDQCLGRLERFHEWYWRERDLHDNGLITVGAYTGNVQHARWETFDYECNMDDLKLTKHPTRKGPKEGAWYGDLCVPGNNAYLILGDKAMAARRRERIAKGVEGMRKHTWDEAAGAFLTVRRDTLEKIPVITIGSWIPLAAGVPTEAHGGSAWLAYMANTFAGAHRGPERQPMEIRGLLARRCMAGDELSNCQRSRRLRASRSRGGYRGQDSRQRHQERIERAL